LRGLQEMYRKRIVNLHAEIASVSSLRGRLGKLTRICAVLRRVV
jgi:hypothetical protein